MKNNVGVIYLMKTVIDGVYKIGKTGEGNFENRMYHLEKNGYSNITGLQREIAIKVENYEEKEKMLHEIFSKSRISETEFFALDRDLIETLFYALKGEIIFPKKINAEEKIEKIAEEKRTKSLRRELIQIIKDGHFKNPSKLKNLLANKKYIKYGKNIKLYSQPYISDKNNLLTIEIEEGIHAYVVFNKEQIKLAIEEYRNFFGEDK